MSAHICPVIKLGPPVAIPNADKIEVFNVMGNGPVICVKGQFREGDLACFIPPESVVDTAREPFAFLKPRARKIDGWCKIKPMRLRGQISVGLLMDPLGKAEGKDCGPEYGVKTYEEHVKIEQPHAKALPWYSRIWRRFFGTSAERGLWPGIPFYDINQLFKMRADLFSDDEVMVITEKLHGTNARYVIGKDGKLWCGSRTMWRMYNESNVYGRAAIEGKFEEKLRKLSDPIVLWGEIVGPNIQRGFSYGLKDGQQKFYCFDMYHATERRFLDPEETALICQWLKIDHVPTDIVACWKYLKNHLDKTAQSASHIGGDHPREGIVVRPYAGVKETHALDGSRCLVAGKVVSPLYYEFRERPGMDENIIL